MVQCVNMGDEVLRYRFMVSGTVGETHAVASAANVVNAEMFVKLSVGKERCRIGGVVELGVVAVCAVGGSFKVTDILGVAVGAENIHLVEDVITIVSCITVEASVNTIDEQAAAWKAFVEHARVVTVLDDIILVRVAAGDFIYVAPVAFP